MAVVGRTLLVLALISSSLRSGRLAVRGPRRRAGVGGFRAPGDVRRGRAGSVRVRDPRRGVRALGLLLQHRRQRFEHDDAAAVPGGRDLVHAAGLAAAVGDADLVLVEPGAVPDPAARARDRPLRAGGAVHARRILPRPHGPVRQPVRDQRQPARRGLGPGSAAAPHDDDGAPADALLGLHADDDPVRVRGRGPDQRPGQRRMDSGHPTLRARRPGCASASGSCSAPAGPTPNWAGVATGPGIRSRTPP